jgi:hypothetical protein
VDRVRGDTALHRIASSVTGVNGIAIVQLLIDAGAHIDCVNNKDQTAADVATMTDIRSLLQSKQRPSRLKCLCARLIVTHQLSYDSVYPSHSALNRFIVLHGDLSRKHVLLDEHSSKEYLDYLDDDSTYDFSDSD